MFLKMEMFSAVDTPKRATVKFFYQAIVADFLAYVIVSIHYTLHFIKSQIYTCMNKQEVP